MVVTYFRIYAQNSFHPKNASVNKKLSVVNPPPRSSSLYNAKNIVTLDALIDASIN